MSTAGLLLAVTGLALPAAARGAVLDVPLVYPSIQQAVDAAAPGDVIRVGAGTYQEHVRVRGDKAAITIEGADVHAMPVLLGTAHKSADGIRVDEVDRITLRNLRIVGAYDGVRLNRVVGAVVSGLVIEDTALGIRINRGADNVVVANTILGTRVEQGILVDGSPGVVLADNVVDAPDEEGIRVVSSARCVVHRNAVRNSQGGNGITVSRSAGASIVESVVVGSYRDGLRVMNCVDLVLSRNRAEANGNVGLRIEKSPPFASVDDVLAQGNVGIGNAGGEVVVEAKRCATSACEPGTTLPTVTTTTSLTTTSAPATSTSFTTTTTTVTSTTLLAPLVEGRWRFYVRILDTSGGSRSVLVPLRSGDSPVEAAIREDHLNAFRIGNRVSGAELLALGGDTRGRLGAAAETYLRAHPAAYVGFAKVLELRWAERVGP